MLRLGNFYFLVNGKFFNNIKPNYLRVPMYSFCVVLCKEKVSNLFLKLRNLLLSCIRIAKRKCQMSLRFIAPSHQAHRNPPRVFADFSVAE